jgi:hypothetical protein
MGSKKSVLNSESMKHIAKTHLGRSFSISEVLVDDSFAKDLGEGAPLIPVHNGRAESEFG